MTNRAWEIACLTEIETRYPDRSEQQQVAIAAVLSHMDSGAYTDLELESKVAMAARIADSVRAYPTDSTEAGMAAALGEPIELVAAANLWAGRTKAEFVRGGQEVPIAPTKLPSYPSL